MTGQALAENENLDRMSPSTRLFALKAGLAEHIGSVLVGDAVGCLGKTGFGMSRLILSLPALILIPSPTGWVFGSTVAIVSFQLCFRTRLGNICHDHGPSRRRANLPDNSARRCR